MKNLPPNLLKLPDDIDKLKGIEWGKQRCPEDVVLPAPVLVAVRYNGDSESWQALYKTIENPEFDPHLSKYGDRGFILTDDGEIHEQSVASIMKWSFQAGWPWEWLD